MNNFLSYGVWSPKLHVPKIETTKNKKLSSDCLKFKSLKDEFVIINEF